MVPHRLLAAIALVPALLLATIVASAAPAAPSPAAPGQQIRLEGPIAEGVHLRERVDPGPVTSVAIEVQPDAPVAFVPVLSGNRIDGGTEYTSSMCHRVGGVVCINANYAVCPTCGQPFGGVVQDGVLLRSPTPFQDQVSVINGRFTLQPWMWSAGLWSRKGGRSLDFHGVNTGMNPGGTYLYTRAYGDSTGTPPGTWELIVRAPKPLWTGIGQRQPVEFLALRNQGDSTIPPDGAVISAYGSSVPQLRHFVDLHKRVHVELVTNTPGGLEQSFAGHPIILKDGQVQPMDPADSKVSSRHPRSILGWDDTGRSWVVVIDGRQRHSRGMTLWEAAEHLRSLGAQHAVNFDGGGSSAMVTTCPSETGWCLRNRPSDGRERNVWVAVALVPRARPQAPPAPPAKQPETSEPEQAEPEKHEPEKHETEKHETEKPEQVEPQQPESGKPEPEPAEPGGAAGHGDPEGGPDQRPGPRSSAKAVDDAELWSTAPAPDSEPEPEPDSDPEPGRESDAGARSGASTASDPEAETATSSSSSAAPERDETATVTTERSARAVPQAPVLPAAEEAIAAGGLVEPGRQSLPAGAVAAATLLVSIEVGALAWFLRRRRRRRATLTP